jgi:hypothetical protein
VPRAAGVALAAALIVAAGAVAAGGSATASGSRCPIRIAGKRLVDPSGRTVYRLHAYRAGRAQVKCSGRTIWALFHAGAASSQEAYFGVRSGDSGRTWKLLLAEPYFGVKAPFTIDAYSGPWTLQGERAAYFTGWCPACGYGTVSLTVTLDGGRQVRHYKLPSLDGFRATAVRASGDYVVVTARSTLRVGPRWRVTSVRVG